MEKGCRRSDLLKKVHKKILEILLTFNRVSDIIQLTVLVE